MSLTNDQRRRIADSLIRAAGDLLAGGAEMPASIPVDVPRRDAAEQIARWLKALPGYGWDQELPEVEGYPRTGRLIRATARVSRLDEPK